MSLQEKIDQDLKEAMRAKDSARLSVLRMVKAALKNAAIEKGGAAAVLDDAEAAAVLRKQIKQREDAIAGFEKGGRAELASAERAEIAILQSYLPAPLDAAALEELVRECIRETGAASAKDMGAVMKLASAKAAGRADGRALSAEVKQQLGG